MSTIQVDRIIPFSSSSVTIEGNVIQANAATTGSNTFVGDQNIQGTITASIQEGFALVGRVGDVSTLVATSSFGGGGSGFPFTGNAVITGSLLVSGSSANDLTIQGRQLITGPNSGQTPLLIISSSDASNTIERGSISIVGSGSFVPTFRISGSSHRNVMGQRAIETTKPGFDYPVFAYQYSAESSSFLYNYTENLSQTASYTVGVFDNGFTQDVELQLVTDVTNGIQFKDIRSDTGFYTTFLKIAPNGGSNPPLEFKRSAEVTGSVNISQVLKLAGQDPLPANGVGQLAVSGSNLYYNNGSNWTQIN